MQKREREETNCQPNAVQREWHTRGLIDLCDGCAPYRTDHHSDVADRQFVRSDHRLFGNPANDSSKTECPEANKPLFHGLNSP
jgi:hypothetical protein